MLATFLWPPSGALALSTGARPRAQPYLVLDGLYPNHTFVKAAYVPPCGSAAAGAAYARCNYVLAVTLLRGGAGGCAAHPAAAAQGAWDGPAPCGNVTIGAWRVGVCGDDIIGGEE